MTTWRELAGRCRPEDAVLVGLVCLNDLDFGRIGLGGIGAARWLVLLPFWIAPIALLLFSRSLLLVLVRPPARYLAGWAAVASVSLWWSVSPDQTVLIGLALTANVVFVLWYVTRLGWDRFAAVFAGAASAFMAIGFVVERLVGARDGAGFRLSGVSSGPTRLGSMAAVAAIIGFNVALSGRSRRLGWTCAALAAITLAWTNARGGMVAVLIAVLVVATMHLGVAGVARRAALPGALVLLAAASGGLGPDDLTRSGNTAELTTLTGRTDVWRIGTQLVAQRPILGHGTGSSYDLFTQATKDGAIHWPPFDAHNVWLGAAIEQGLVGALLFTAAVVACARRWRGLGPWPIAALVVFVVNGLTEALTFRPTVPLVVIAAVVGCATGASCSPLAGPSVGDPGGARPPTIGLHR